jgi:hypothetical protein
MDPEKLEEIEEKPMGDNDIKIYFPDAKIIVYNDLNDIKSINELLPKDKSYFFLLIEQKVNNGHWVCINKLDNKIEFFDSYGGKPDSQLSWIPMEKREELGSDEKRLTELFRKSGLKVNYNPFKYQEVDNDIQTCGRHCCMRIKTMLDGKNLDDYHKYMKQLKDSRDMTFDEVVSFFIRR